MVVYNKVHKMDVKNKKRKTRNDENNFIVSSYEKNIELKSHTIK